MGRGHGGTRVTGPASARGENISNFISQTYDEETYTNAFDDQFQNIDEDYSVSFEYGNIERTFSELGKTESVSVDNIVSSQDYLDSAKLAEYVKSKKYDGAWGVRFAGSDEVLIRDGNHRIAAAMKNGVSTVNMKIITIG